MTTAVTFAMSGLDLATAKPENVRSIFILRLPFRLRVGTLRKFTYDDTYQVWVRNRLDVPAGTKHEEFHKKIADPANRRARFDLAFSEVMIVCNRVNVDQGTVQAIINNLDGKGGDPVAYDNKPFKALGVLNDFLVAVHTATGELFGGRPLCKLTDSMFFDCLRFEFTLLCRPEMELDDEYATQLFDTHVDREFIKGQQFFGEWGDWPADKVAGIEQAIRQQDQFIFYEFAFESKSRMVDREFVPALLYSVVALEGAHAAFVKQSLQAKFAFVENERDRSRLVEEHAERLLREAGLTTLYQLTPFLFMEQDERPTLEELEECGKGISIRNEIMHSLAKKGQYKLRNRTPEDLTDAYEAVLKVYDRYRAAVEKRNK